MNIGMRKRRKVQCHTKRSSLFDFFPDEMVLTILSYGTMEDIRSTRVWQSIKVQQYTETKNVLEATKNNNFDNLKWIHQYIGNKEFLKDKYFDLQLEGN